MGERASQLFPFAIAVVLPPAGLILGLVSLEKGDKDLGVRLVVVSVLAAVIWVLLFVS